MNRALIIAAHPDDEVLGMGGTIAKLTATGCEVNVLIVTDGSSSQYGNSPDLSTIIEDKKIETKNCNDVLGVRQVYYGGLPDMRLDSIPHIEVNLVIERHIELLQPDTVFTHFWGDVNMDHQNVYKSTLVAVRPLANQMVKSLYCYRVPSSTEWTPNKPDTMFVPNVFVDISKYAETKYMAFSKYSTEIREYPHPRSIRHLKELDVAAGLRVGQGPTEELMLLRSLI